jgi:TBC1 domain family member 8/9
MFNLTSFVQKAQSFIDPSLSGVTISSDRKPSKSVLFRHQFRLPDTQNPLQEISAELSVPAPHTSHAAGVAQGDGEKRERGSHYSGKLHLSENYMCFSTQQTSFVQSASTGTSSSFTGQTHGTGPGGNGFTLPLSAIRRVERLHSQSFMFALAITMWNGSSAPAENTTPQRITIQLSGSRQQCERFCDGLKKGLREGVGEVGKLKKVVSECYSEYLLGSDGRKPGSKDAPKARDIPDAGLGMVFKYPGDARKLRDRSKMRLWGEYLRGKLLVYLTWFGGLLTN